MVLIKKVSSKKMLYNFANWICWQNLWEMPEKEFFFQLHCRHIACSIAKNELSQKYFSRILTKNLRESMWLSVSACKYRQSLICLLRSFTAIIELLNLLLNSLLNIFMGINILAYIEICDSDVCDSIETIL